MFNNLTSKISQILKNISGYGRLTEENIKETLREVRIALLEADVALSVVKDFIESVKESALGIDINKNLTPSQAFIKILQNKLIEAMGKKNSTLNLSVQPPAVILMIGLQGAGKTTTVAKLGKFLKEKQKKKVLVVSTDIYRPAAIKQLEILAKLVGINFFLSTLNEKPVNIVTKALQYAKLKFYDVIIVDTAGFIHFDIVMMNEIQLIYKVINPIETLFIVDAMTGQDAINIANSFNKKIILTGIILTKVDSDTRGGAALSIRHITGKQIKFLGTSESIDGLEPFHPERIASRILGMGDILSLIEEIENKIDHKKVKKLTYKLKKGKNFDLNDFFDYIKQVRNIDNTSSILNKISGISKIYNLVKLQLDNKILIKMEAIINSMTPYERQKPEIIKGSRKKRIAFGSGTKVQDVNYLLKQFNYIYHIMKKVKNGELSKIINGIKNIIS